MRVGLCTTLKLPDGTPDQRRRSRKVLRTFIRFHINVGFCRIFAFLDDPLQATTLETRQVESEFPVVTFLLNTKAQRDWQKLHCNDVYEAMNPYLEQEVTARQTVNAAHALSLAQEESLDWLMHLDIDELFYTSKPSIQQHFEGLTQDGVMQMTYVNHEGVPEARGPQEDYFRGVRLFRRHPLALPLLGGGGAGPGPGGGGAGGGGGGEGGRGPRAAAAAALAFWEGRTGHGQYFLAYDNGKSAVRVAAGARPRDVHRWRCPPPPENNGPPEERSRTGENGPEERSRTALLDPRGGLDARRFRPCADPCVLHFVNCGFNWFKEKYDVLGDFDDAWFGGKLPIAPCFHLDARNLMRESKKKKSRQAEIHQREDVVTITGDSNDDDVEYFYNNQVVLDDIDQISFQLEAEVCFRLNKTITEILGEDEEECVGIHGKEEKCALPSSLHMDSEQDKSEPFSSHSSKHQNSSIGSSCTLSASSGSTKEYHNNTTAGDEACYCDDDDDGDDDDTTSADFSSGRDTTDQSSTKLGQANMYNNNNSNKTEVTSEFTYKKAWILASVAQNYL